ncbi:hypothetical protein BDC45DRAFT_526191 [Circinella umbellata]|nr:hypothetical protein BDC45DRAFT_526191 [Circinella umbellata]
MTISYICRKKWLHSRAIFRILSFKHFLAGETFYGYGPVVSSNLLSHLLDWIPGFLAYFIFLFSLCITARKPLHDTHIMKTNTVLHPSKYIFYQKYEE